jgi:hypothetical protein
MSLWPGVAAPLPPRCYAPDHAKTTNSKAANETTYFRDGFQLKNKTQKGVDH